jgi:hypothetical protein
MTTLITGQTWINIPTIDVDALCSIELSPNKSDQVAPQSEKEEGATFHRATGVCLELWGKYGYLGSYAPNGGYSALRAERC